MINFIILNLLNITLLYFTIIKVGLFTLLNLISLLFITIGIIYFLTSEVIYTSHLLTFVEVEYTLLILALITFLNV